MTGREMLAFLQSLDDADLDMDIEIDAEKPKEKHAYSNVFAEGMACDCNGIYILDERGVRNYNDKMVIGDKVSWEVEEYAEI